MADIEERKKESETGDQSLGAPSDDKYKSDQSEHSDDQPKGTSIPSKDQFGNYGKSDLMPGGTGLGAGSLMGPNNPAFWKPDQDKSGSGVDPQDPSNPSNPLNPGHFIQHDLQGQEGNEGNLPNKQQFPIPGTNPVNPFGMDDKGPQGMM